LEGVAGEVAVYLVSHPLFEVCLRLLHSFLLGRSSGNPTHIFITSSYSMKSAPVLYHTKEMHTSSCFNH
jgi:hypothetical protein